MSSFLPPRFPFGRRPSPFYICECPKCGFQQSYELGDPDSVISIGDEDPESIKTVEEIPAVCPKCGAKWKKKQLPDTRKY
ncbi:MAG: hypothetical protein IJS15_15545 [Victivallales bacterium]|nr:hypothetical protein [Victivallales bacterium]